MEKNLTTGSVFKNTVLFSLPFLLSYFLQTLYGMADLFIVGQFDGTASITAVAIGSQIMHMITVMIVGLAMGSTVAIGRAVGEGRHDKAAGAAGNTASLFLAGSVIFAAVLILLVKPLTTLLALRRRQFAERFSISSSASRESRSLRHTTSSVPSTVDSATARARCISSPLHAS